MVIMVMMVIHFVHLVLVLPMGQHSPPAIMLVVVLIFLKIPVFILVMVITSVNALIFLEEIHSFFILRYILQRYTSN